MIALSYGNGRTVRVPKGLSVLEASLRNNVPHASVCGGRARCSTCRIRIIGDCSALPEPSQREAFVLARVGASDPSIRLACQLRPTEDLSFFQLFLPSTTTASTHASNPARIGQERYLVSLFVDMRGSTQLAEKRLPFDTVFVVNRFLAAVAQAVMECGGRPNQFLGDGMLALFGLGATAQLACRQALRAAAMISANIDELNQFLSHDLREPIRFGIGIHGGEVIVGDIGYRDHMVFTALGDPVNVAARLQDMTKSLACEAVVSEEVRVTAGLAADDLPQREVDIRGRAEPMKVRVVAQAKTLAPLVDGAFVAPRCRAAGCGRNCCVISSTSEHPFRKFSPACIRTGLRRRLRLTGAVGNNVTRAQAKRTPAQQSENDHVSQACSWTRCRNRSRHRRAGADRCFRQAVRLGWRLGLPSSPHWYRPRLRRRRCRCRKLLRDAAGGDAVRPALSHRERLRLLREPFHLKWKSRPPACRDFPFVSHCSGYAPKA